MKTLACKLSILILPIIGACSGDEENEPKLSDAELLTGGSQKEWVITAEVPEDEIESCRPDSPIFIDNTYTFYKDGKMTFDHGTITEDPNCMEANCCGDLINFTGTWEFTNNGKNLKVVMGYDTDDVNNVIDEDLFDLPFTLSVDKLIIIETLNGVQHTITFSPK